LNRKIDYTGTPLPPEEVRICKAVAGNAALYHYLRGPLAKVRRHQEDGKQLLLNASALCSEKSPTWELPPREKTEALGVCPRCKAKAAALQSSKAASIAASLLAALVILSACASGGPVMQFSASPAYLPGIPSTGRLDLRVVDSSFELAHSWDVSGSRPVLVVVASTQAHPGRAFVQVRRLTQNALGGTLDELLDIRPWGGSPGLPSRETFRFQGHGQPLTADVYLQVQVAGEPL
jgi:hypothetical protein